MTDGPPYGADAPLFDLARYNNVYLKATPLNFAPPQWGKATPESFFGKLVETFGASRIAFGSNFPATAGTLAEILGKAQGSRSRSFLPATASGFSARPRRRFILRSRTKGS